MPQLLGSKVIVQEATPAALNVPTLETSKTGCVVITEKGPTNEAVRCTSYEQYAAVFGSHITSSDAAAHVRAFFDEGGAELWVVRAVHCSDASDPTTKASAQATMTLSTSALAATSGVVQGTLAGPFNFEPGDILALKVDGGAATSATFTATAAARESAAQPIALANNDTLLVAIDGGSVQTIQFLSSEFSAIGAATAIEIAAVINAKIVGARATVTSGGTKVTITSDRRGTGSVVNVSGGTGNAGKLSYTTGALAGTGNVSNIDAVTAAEIKTVVEAAVVTVTVGTASNMVSITRNTTGAAASVQVDGAVSTVETIVGLDTAVHAGNNAGTLSTLTVKGRYDGTYAHAYRAKISAPTSGDAGEFNFQILDASGVVKEEWSNVSMDSTSARYVVDVINAAVDAGGSRLFSVTDLAAATTTASKVPATGTFGPPSGGNDGLSGIVDADFIGGVSAAGKVGIRALDAVQGLRLLIVPGRATAAIAAAMISYCESTRGKSCFAILDPPASQTDVQMGTYVQSTAAIRGLSEFGAIYWPRVKISNPSRTVYGTGTTITIAPSAHMAGLFGRVDGARDGGVYDPPAGRESAVLFTVVGLERSVETGDSQCDYLYPKLVNPIAQPKEGGAFFVDGSRTLKDTSNFPWINQRRGAIHIEQSLHAAFDVKRHQKNTPALRAALARGADDYLTKQLQKDAFSTTDKAGAFFVDVGDAINPTSQPNQINARFGLSFATPFEFGVLEFSKLLS